MILPRPPGLGHHNVSSTPMEVGGDLAGVEVKQISTYGDCSLAVSADGQLYGWGNSEYLQLASVTEATQVRFGAVAVLEAHLGKNTTKQQRSFGLIAVCLCRSALLGCSL